MSFPPGQTPDVQPSRLSQEFDFAALSPPPEAVDLLLLDTAAAWWEQGHPRDGVLILDDRSGALTLPILDSLISSAGRPGAACAAVEDAVSAVRVLQDELGAELGLQRNARRYELPAPVPQELPSLTEVEPAAFSGVHTVLMHLPRSLETLADWAWLIREHAASDVVVLAAGRDKHMNHSMNQVLEKHFTDVSAGRGRSKSRILTARTPRTEVPAVEPRTQTHQISVPGAAPTELTLCSMGATYGGTKLDPGTRLMLQTAEAQAGFPGAAEAVDFGSGNGTVSAFLALRHPELRVIATDHSASAVQSTRLTAAANGVADRVTTLRDDALSRFADSSAQLILLNPPFHQGNAVDPAAANRLIRAAARVLAPGGRLYCVFNSHLKHRAVLTREVGPTEQLARDSRFTVTVSTAS
ncbi:class I SAM-dependent methyltransferase [Nesterenkonia lutea]|uniref:16S rRNA (Guanine1207-N2)-methyltransferase n=1 Tax=Nesterenkonia lutea TaxID=272919 RepID=A0ABR9JDY8_9MICC|nr:methyltransferase [Nesterenkonia lutea]MBE1524147.1 16S rRNA (guanine1207-N2)-methyltransferase [Nesterenkonia lutea]